MELLTGLGPLGALLIAVVWFVTRGMRHDTHDHDTGGGSDSSHGD